MLGKGVRDMRVKTTDLNEPDQPEMVAWPSLIDEAVFITGATATGKSRLALAIARALGGEILSLDSIAVYQGMDIGTAKPGVDDRARVPHHLIDIASPTDEFSVAMYLQHAHAAVTEIRERGRIPIFVGGTPMFLKGVLRGFDPGPPADWDFRRQVEADLNRHGIAALHQRLWQVDPLAASKIDANDSRRMIRALEVAKLTGQPISHRQLQFRAIRDAKDCRAFVIRRERDRLHQRINDRVERMFAAGFVDEVRRLLDIHGGLSRTAATAVGYRETLEFLAGGGDERDAAGLAELKQQVAAHTRQMARRQETWFRSLSELTPITGDEVDDDLTGVLKRIRPRP